VDVKVKVACSALDDSVEHLALGALWFTGSSTVQHKSAAFVQKNSPEALSLKPRPTTAFNERADRHGASR